MFAQQQMMPQQQMMQGFNRTPSYSGSYLSLPNPFSHMGMNGNYGSMQNWMQGPNDPGYYNRPYPNPFPNPFPFPKPFPNPFDCDFSKDGWDKGGKDPGGKDRLDAVRRLTGKASIDGGEFRSIDGEKWAPGVKADKSYNLLSTDKLQINGSYESVDGETVLGQTGILTEHGQLTLSADGTLLVDGKDFKKGKNDLNGTLTMKGDEYTLTTSEGYVIKLKPDADDGIKLDIDAKLVKVGAGGLLGSANDGEKNSASDLKSDLDPDDFEVDDVLSFDSDDTLDEEERNAILWKSRNPKYDSTSLTVGPSGFGFSADGQKIADWKMTALKADKPYLLFSDQDLSVSGTFKASANGAPQELSSVGLVVDGLARKVTLGEHGNIEVRDKNNNIVKVPGLKGNSVTFPITNEDGESYEITVFRNANRKLELKIDGKNIGDNEYRSGGLLGDAIGARSDNGKDDNGAGYIRDEDGGLSKAGSNMTAPLREFELSSLFDVESDRGVEDITEALEPGQAPVKPTYHDVAGKTWGDPHFIGADGEMYDIQGKSGEIYNIVSDQGLQVNALWDKWHNTETTVVRKVGFNINGHQLEVGQDMAGKRLTFKLDGQEITAANMPSWMTLAGDKLTVVSDFQGEKWRFEVDYMRNAAGDYLDLHSRGVQIDDFVETAGIWGHSIGKNDLYKHNGQYQKGGGGIIRNADGTTLAFDKKEGSAEHNAALANYKETDLFSTSSHWSQFNK